MSETITFLMTSTGGSLVPALFQYLKEQRQFSIRLIAVDAGNTETVRHFADASYEVPFGSEPNYVDRLLEISNRENVDVILPGSDEEAFAISGSIEKFHNAGVKPIVSPRSCLDLIAGKLETYDALKQAGLRTPEYAALDGTEDVEAALRDFGFPKRNVVVKPSRGRGGRGMHAFVGGGDVPQWLLAGDREKLILGPPTESFHDELAGQQLIVMPMLKPPAYDVDVLGRSNAGPVAVLRRRGNPTGIPYRGYQIISNPDVRQYCVDAASVLNLSSLHDMDFMTDEDGQMVLLEVNPRPSGSVLFSEVAGYPLIEAAIADRLSLSFEWSAGDTSMDMVNFIQVAPV